VSPLTDLNRHFGLREEVAPLRPSIIEGPAEMRSSDSSMVL